MYLATADQIRQADRIQINEKAYPGVLLMERAGQQCAHWLLDQFPDQQTYLIMVGPGNNGGDGLVIARYLYLAGKEVKILMSHTGDRFQVDALINYRIIQHLPILVLPYQADAFATAMESFGQQPVILDALLGTGIRKAPRGPVKDLISAMIETPATVIAIDIPSGLEANSGHVSFQVAPAEATLTFQVPKICHYVYPAAAVCGTPVVLDIGLWPAVMGDLGIQRRVLTHQIVQVWQKTRKPAGHKGTFGHVLIAGGSERLAGAVALTALATMRAGAGLSTVLTVEACRQVVLNQVPETMVYAQAGAYLNRQAAQGGISLLEGKKAVVIGPGLGRSDQSLKFLKEILPKIKVPLVLDADALNLLSQGNGLWDLLPQTVILTPHPGEMQRLTGDTSSKTYRLEAAEKLAYQKQVTVVLKGAGTIIAFPTGKTYVNPTGNPGMGTAGSGDVLAGVIGGLLAQGYSVKEATCMGVYLHGLAGDLVAAELGESALMARDLIHYWPQAFAQLTISDRSIRSK